MSELQEQLQVLCSLSGVSSREEAVRDYILSQAAPYADSCLVDTLGSLIVFKRGKKPTGNKLLLDAHMDEVGLMVREITEDGYLRFDCVGGIDRRVLPSKRVFVGENRIPGIIGMKPIHLTEGEERKKLPPLKEFYIDIGAESRESATALVEPGDVAVFSQETILFGNGMLKAKALDDRVGCAVMLTLIRETLPMDCTFVFSVQEEVGCRGAFGAAFSVAPEIALVLEGTTAADLPGVKPARRVCRCGGGAVVPFMDGGSIGDKGLYTLATRLAEENDIPWQTKEYISGGTDARSIQRTKQGARVLGISAPVRYLHSPSSVVKLSDVEAVLNLTRLMIGALAEEEGQ